MANAGGRLYVVRTGLRTSVVDTKMLSVDPAAPLLVPNSEVEAGIAPTGPRKRSWMDASSGLFTDGPPDRGDFACAELGGEVLTFGGIDLPRQQGTMSDLWVFDLVNGDWTDLSALAAAQGSTPPARGRHGMVSVDGLIFVCGGFVGGTHI